MGATRFMFRLRTLILFVVVFLGFWSPWIEILHLGQRLSLLEWLALEISRLGLLTFTAATPVVIILGSLIAAAGVVLRIWGTACLGPATVLHARMQAGALVVSGPYRYVRNPLYLGVWCMMAAMSFIMPPTGALFTMVLVTFFVLRLIHGEEAFLTAQLGQPYRDYLRAVPRLIPLLRTALPAGSDRPVWGSAILAELNPLGVFFTLAVLSWSYNNLLMIKGVIISFGVALVVRALLPGQSAAGN